MKLNGGGVTQNMTVFEFFVKNKLKNKSYRCFCRHVHKT